MIDDRFPEGLEWLEEELIQHVQQACVKTGVNDPCILVFTRPDNRTAAVYTVTREGALRVFAQALPEAVLTIARINSEAKIAKMLVIVWYSDGVFSFEMPIKGTDGVLN